MTETPSTMREPFLVSTRSWLLLLAAVVGAWLALTCLAIPGLLALAYYGGDSLPWLGRLLEGRATHSFGHYLGAWTWLIPHGLSVITLSWLVPFVMSRPSFFRRCVGAATPGTLGAIRMWVCAILFAMVVNERLAHLAWFPEEFRRPMGLMGVFYALPIGMDRLVASEAGLQLFQYATELALLLGMAGLGTRIVMPLATLCVLVFFGLLRQYSFFWHQGLITTYLMAVLSFTPCGDGWSLDRLLRIARGRPVPPANQATVRYGWARYACWIAIALPYMAAGMSKFGNVGWFWWAPDNMRRFLYTDTLNPVQFDWQVSLQLVHAPDLFFALVGLSGVLGEALYGLVLVWPLARKVLPAAMLSMHVGIAFLQNILFPDLIFIQAVFYNWTPLRLAIERWLAARRGSVQPSTPTMTVPVADTRAPAWRHIVPASALFWAFFFCWFYRVECYPFTAMQMYTEKWRFASPAILYYKTEARRADGQASRRYFRQAMGTMAHNARYRPMFGRCFGTPEQVARCSGFFRSAATGYNRHAPPEARISQIEIQQWQCPMSNPADGQLINRMIIDVPT